MVEGPYGEVRDPGSRTNVSQPAKRYAGPAGDDRLAVSRFGSGYLLGDVERTAGRFQRLARRVRCWLRGRHEYAVLAVEEVDGELVGRLACKDCGREPEPDARG